MRKAERILNDPQEAADVVHGLFVELIQRKAGQDGEITLPYLYRAVTNRCLNVLRDQRQRQRLLERHEPALRGQARVRCDDQVIGLELLAKLALRLDRPHMEVLICRYFDDMPQEEIAVFVGASRKTVGKRLARIRDAVAALGGGKDS